MQNIEKNNKIRMMVEAGIMMALTVVLNNIKLYHMPKGGSVTLGGYVPLMIFAIRWGTKRGLLVGMTYGLLDALIDPYIIAPLQFLLDYPLAYAMLGFAGLVGQDKDFKAPVEKLKLIGSIILANFLRFLMAFLSGIIFFKEYLPTDIPYVLGSIIYNGSYVIPNMIISIIMILLILPRLKEIDK